MIWGIVENVNAATEIVPLFFYFTTKVCSPVDLIHTPSYKKQCERKVGKQKKREEQNAVFQWMLSEPYVSVPAA